MLNFSTLSDAWIYVGILIAAIVEGEVAYIAAAAMVAHGRLNPLSVVLAGTVGAAIGDQAFFYLFRGRLPRWMARFPTLERKTAPLLDRVRQHSWLMVLLVRFAPGLRIAIAAACAWIEVPALTFSVLSLASAFVWAVALLGLVGWLGPAYLAHVGLGGWKGAALTGLLVLALFKVLGKYEARVVEPVAAERT